jgi:hypothetical protein
MHASKVGLIGLNFDGSMLMITFNYNMRHPQPWMFGQGEPF